MLLMGRGRISMSIGETELIVDLYRFGSDHLRSYTSLKEAELGTNNQDTHRLYRGEDIDGRET
jgi:hypothetical protein